MSQSISHSPPKIFISYRRDDSAGYALHLFDSLSARFGRDRIFMDIEQIEPGADFVQAIEGAVGSCDVLVALIGRHWLTATDGTSRRLDDPNDFIRLEIVSALNRNVRVIPVLVQGATMPGPQDLPEEMASFSRRNAFELSDRRWKHDVDQLIAALEKIGRRESQLGTGQEEIRGGEAEVPRQTEDAGRFEQAASEGEQGRRGAEGVVQQRTVERVPVATGERAANARPDVAPSSAETAAPPAVMMDGGAKHPRRLKTALVVACTVLLILIGVLLFGRLALEPARREGVPMPTGSRAESGAQRIELVWILPGSFMMGSEKGHGDEKPVQRVTISQGFYMGRYEVTQAQWQAVMGTNPSNFKGDNLPVEEVSWNDAQEFIGRLNARNDGYTYRLPSEAEWEYAARAGTTGDYAGDIDTMAWYGNNSGRTRLAAAEIFRSDPQNYYRRITDNGGQTHPVGSKRPNAFGLFDMHGNVWEWCEDWYHESYVGAPLDGGAWLSGGRQKERVLRGGSWYFPADFCRSSCRNRNPPDSHYDSNGIRVVAVTRQ
jgi:formylglycine-generating enzyme required for sulfatase activity